MSKFLLVSTRDSRTQSFGFVQTVNHLVDAERTFIDIIKRGDNNISKFPDDFSLHHIGSYDSSTGLVEPLPAPVLIITARQLVDTFTN
jgi:uncharacterized protein YpiB (UPF0302 family)